MKKTVVAAVALASAFLFTLPNHAQAQATAGTQNAPAATTGKDLAGSAALSSNHTTLLAMLNVAGLTQRAKAAGPYTVFAPTNEAFNKLPQATRDALMKPTARKKLTGILTYHVVEGNVKAADLTDGQQLKTVQGATLTVKKQGDTVMLHDAAGGMATVTQADITATNGIVHSIDTVLMPSAQ